MKMTSVDDMNIVKDLFIIPPEPSDGSRCRKVAENAWRMRLTTRCDAIKII